MIFPFIQASTIRISRSLLLTLAPVIICLSYSVSVAQQPLPAASEPNPAARLLLYVDQQKFKLSAIFESEDKLSAQYIKDAKATKGGNQPLHSVFLLINAPKEKKEPLAKDLLDKIIKHKDDPRNEYTLFAKYCEEQLGFAPVYSSPGGSAGTITPEEAEERKKAALDEAAKAETAKVEAERLAKVANDEAARAKGAKAETDQLVAKAQKDLGGIKEKLTESQLKLDATDSKWKEIQKKALDKEKELEKQPDETLRKLNAAEARADGLQIWLVVIASVGVGLLITTACLAILWRNGKKTPPLIEVENRCLNATNVAKQDGGNLPVMIEKEKKLPAPTVKKEPDFQGEGATQSDLEKRVRSYLSEIQSDERYSPAYRELVSAWGGNIIDPNPVNRHLLQEAEKPFASIVGIDTQTNTNAESLRLRLSDFNAAFANAAVHYSAVAGTDSQLAKILLRMAESSEDEKTAPHPSLIADFFKHNSSTILEKGTIPFANELADHASDVETVAAKKLEDKQKEVNRISARLTEISGKLQKRDEELKSKNSAYEAAVTELEQLKKRLRSDPSEVEQIANIAKTLAGEEFADHDQRTPGELIRHILESQKSACEKERAKRDTADQDLKLEKAVLSRTQRDLAQAVQDRDRFKDDASQAQEKISALDASVAGAKQAADKAEAARAAIENELSLKMNELETAVGERDIAIGEGDTLRGKVEQLTGLLRTRVPLQRAAIPDLRTADNATFPPLVQLLDNLDGEPSPASTALMGELVVFGTLMNHGSDVEVVRGLVDLSRRIFGYVREAKGVDLNNEESLKQSEFQVGEEVMLWAASMERYVEITRRQHPLRLKIFVPRADEQLSLESMEPKRPRSRNVQWVETWAIRAPQGSPPELSIRALVCT